MRIAVFENEWTNVEAAFLASNIIHFNDQLTFEIFVSSQEFGDFNKIVEYKLVLVDLDLSIKSEMDGFGIIRQLKNIVNCPPIVILTGSSSVREKLDKFGLGTFHIIVKPVDIDDVYDKITKAINS